jgi:hypothetical protein
VYQQDSARTIRRGASGNPGKRLQRSTSQQFSTIYLRLSRDFVKLVEFPSEMRATGFAIKVQEEDKGGIAL